MIHIKYVAVQNKRCNNTAVPAEYKMVDGEGLLYVPVHGLGPASMGRLFTLPLTKDNYHTRRDDYSDTYRSRCEKQCTAVRTNNAVPVH